MKFYVYEWFNTKTNEIIYVGKGCHNRYKVRKHNRLFNLEIQKGEYESRIIKYFDNEIEAFDYEFNRINELRGIGQCKCNIYNGGLGGTTSWWTDEKRQMYSKNNIMKSEKNRKRMSKYNPMKNPEIVKKVKTKTNKKIVLGNQIYESIKAVADEYNICDTAIQYWIKRGYGRNNEPCYYYGQEPKPIILRNHQTNNKPVIINGKYFENVKTGAEYLGVWSESLIKAIKKNKLCKGYKCEYANQQPSANLND